jgi:hypothetical protein
MNDLEIYRTPTLATVSPERLAAVVRAYRQELVVLARDQAYAGAAWALEAIDSLAGRVRDLERQAEAPAPMRPAVYVDPAPPEAVQDVPLETASKPARRVRG